MIFDTWCSKLRSWSIPLGFWCVNDKRLKAKDLRPKIKGPRVKVERLRAREFDLMTLNW